MYNPHDYGAAMQTSALESRQARNTNTITELALMVKYLARTVEALYVRVSELEGDGAKLRENVRQPTEYPSSRTMADIASGRLKFQDGQSVSFDQISRSK